MSGSSKVLFGFHAVGVRLKVAPASVIEIYVDASRRDARMKQFLARAQEAGARVIEADGLRLTRLAGSAGHQGVAARVQELERSRSLDDLLDGLPKDHAAGINATVAKVASGAAETVPYFMVTNLARTLGELKERGIWVTGTAGEAQKTLYEADFAGPAALVLGAEGAGLRQLTRRSCDELVRIPMRGAVESLNVSVASGICLYEALRQRGG